MQFVADRTSVPVPRVRSAFVHRGATYIVMTKIDGQMAWRRWGQRSEASRERILGQLRGMVSELRALRPPPDSVGVANVERRVHL